jgi:hypothetical protein
MPLSPVPVNIAPDAASAASAAIMALIDALVAKGALATEDVSALLGVAARDLGSRQQMPASLMVTQLMQRLAKRKV